MEKLQDNDSLDNLSYQCPSDGNGTDTESKNTDEQTFIIPEKQKLGFLSVVFIIVNSMIGTGIFATPASIYASVNNAGMSFVLWVIGAIFTACSLMVYLEFGTADPRSGGEKNYVSYF
jgi:amino acid transporter